jgi:hypothetical protein
MLINIHSRRVWQLKKIIAAYCRVSSQAVFAVLVVILTTTSLNGQTLTFSTPPTEYSNILVGGQAYGMGGVGTAIWNNNLYVAYTDNSGNGDLWLIHTSDGTTFSAPTQVTSSPTAVYSANNPSLAVYSGALYVAYVDSSGGPDYVSTTDGTSFSAVNKLCGGTAGASPSMAVFNSKLFMGYLNATNHTLSVCTIETGYITSYSQYPSISLGDSPSLGVFGSTLYIAYRDNSSSHYIYLAYSSTGTSFTVSTGPNSSHTSTAPSIVVHNGYLYILFRQNSSGDRLYYTYSSNGSSFSSPIEVGITMGGPPSGVTATFNCCSSLNGDLFAVFRQNDTGHYLFTTHAP